MVWRRQSTTCLCLSSNTPFCCNKRVAQCTAYKMWQHLMVWSCSSSHMLDAMERWWKAMRDAILRVVLCRGERSVLRTTCVEAGTFSTWKCRNLVGTRGNLVGSSFLRIRQIVFRLVVLLLRHTTPIRSCHPGPGDDTLRELNCMRKILRFSYFYRDSPRKILKKGHAGAFRAGSHSGLF